MEIIFRSYAGPDDLQAMIGLTEELRRRGQRVYPIAADLYEELSDADSRRSVRLWERNDCLIGFAYINPYQNMVDVFTADAFTPDLRAEMMAWLIEAARQRNRAGGKKLTLDAGVLEDDLPRLALLEDFGFERQAESSILMGCPLDGALPEPELPPGFAIRPMGGLAEIEAYVALHRAAFGTGNMTVAYRQSIMSTPGYLPELDLVAVAPGGELAALCVCQIFADDAPRAGGQKEGWTDPVATHPDYRRLGLAKALILSGMRLLRQRGIDTALLGTGSTNEAMQRVARGIGFRQVSNTLWYCRAVDG